MAQLNMLKKRNTKRLFTLGGSPMFKQKLKTEEGSGLVLTLMVLLVLSVLGASLGVVTIGSNRLGHATQDSNSAYYIAEAGANMAYEEIEAYVLDAHGTSDGEGSFFGKIDSPLGENNNKNNATYNNFELQSGDQPIANVEVESVKKEDSTKTYKIVSTGQIGSSTRTVEKEFEVTWRETSNDGGLPFIPPNASIVVNNEVKLTNGYINGNLYLDSKNANTFEISNSGAVGFDSVYTSYEGNEIKDIYYGTGKNTKTEGNRTHKNNTDLPWNEYYSLVESFPDFSNLNFDTLPTDKVISKNSNDYFIYENNNIILSQEFLNGYVYELKNNVYINKIEVISNRTLNIDTAGNDIIIHVNNLLVDSGRLNIIGNGSVTFFVQNDFQLNSSSEINTSGNTKQLTIFYNQLPRKKFTLSGGNKINGNLFFKHGDVELGGSSSLSGSLLLGGDNFTFSGSSTNNLIIIAPKSQIKLTGSGNNNGILVGDTVELTGGSKVSYSEGNIPDFPFSSSSGNENLTPNINDLISTDPAIEK